MIETKDYLIDLIKKIKETIEIVLDGRDGVQDSFDPMFTADENCCQTVEGKRCPRYICSEKN